MYFNVSEFKSKRFFISMAKLKDRCFSYVTAAMFVSLQRTQTWRLHTKLSKFGQHTSSSSSSSSFICLIKIKRRMSSNKIMARRPQETARLMRIVHEWKTAETWFLARVFILQSSIISQILECIYWMVTILVLITWLVKTENNPNIHSM